jgi:16S rRNA processing protein RimM
MNNTIHIGKIVATFGVQGELIIKHALGKKIQFKKGEPIFFEINKGNLLPYFIEQSKARTPEEIVVKIEGINTKENAKLFVNKPVWITEEQFKNLAAKKAPIALLGLTIIDNGKILGKIEEVIEQPHQILVQIKMGGKEVLIPIHKDSLIKIDRKLNEVHVAIPDGLLDIYLQ